MKSVFQSFNFPGRPVDLIGSASIMFDQAAENNKALFEKTYIDEWFTVAPPQYGLTVKSIIGSRNIRFMASVIGNTALTPLRPTDGFKEWSGEIPRYGHKFPRTADDVRRWFEVYENIRIKDEAKAKRLENTLVTDLRDAYLGCKDAASSIVLQALSNDGVAVFKPELNNPDGRAYSVDYNMPDENKIEADFDWTDANAKNLDFLAFMQEIKFYMEAKGVDFANGELLLSPELLFWIIQTPKLKKVIYGSDKADSLVSEAKFNDILTTWGLPKVRKVVKKNRIQMDGKPKLIDHWNGDFMAFKPAGLLGEIQPAFEDSEIIPEPDVTYMNADGGIRIAKWQVGESTGQVAGEYTQASWRAIPIIENIDSILSIKVRNTGK